MNIMELGPIGELVGGVAVIGSLLFVGLQVRQNTLATRATNLFLESGIGRCVSRENRPTQVWAAAPIQRLLRTGITLAILMFAAGPAASFTIEFENADFGMNPTFSNVVTFSFSIEVAGPLVPGVYDDPVLTGVQYRVSGQLAPGTPSGFPSFNLERTIGGAEFYGQGSSMRFEISNAANLADGLQVSELVGGANVFVFNAREVGTGRYHPSLLQLDSDGSGLLRNSNNMGGINPASMEEVDVQIGEEYVTELSFVPETLTLALPEPSSKALLLVLGLTGLAARQLA